MRYSRYLASLFSGEPLLFVCGIPEYVRDQGIIQALEACVPSRAQIGKMDQATTTGGFFSTRLNVVCGIL